MFQLFPSLAVPVLVCAVILAVRGSAVPSTQLRVKRQFSTCLLPQPLRHGQYRPSHDLCPPKDDSPACSMVPGTSVPEEWTLHYSCDKGYGGNTTRSDSVCYRGRWTPTLPVCGKLCPPLRSQGVDIKCMFGNQVVPCGEPMRPGTVASQLCKDYYHLDFEPDTTQLRCLDIGVWDYPLLECTPDKICKQQGIVSWYCKKISQCPTAQEELKNGSIPEYCNLPGNDLFVCCEPNITKLGQQSLSAVLQSHQKLCSPLRSQGVEIKCTFGNQVVPCGEPMRPGTVARQQCKDYYHLVVEPETLQLKCLDIGAWDYPLLECTPDKICKQQGDKLWSCKKLSQCPKAQEDMKNGLTLETCDPIGSETSVCCEPQSVKTRQEVEPSFNLIRCGISEITKISPLIIDGREAQVGSFPWHAGLYLSVENNRSEIFWEQKCGGSLITDRFILSAAHCVDKRHENEVRVALGKYFRSWDHEEETEQKRNVSKIIQHDDFRPGTFYFDIALLLLDKKVELGDNIMPVCRGLRDMSNYVLDKKLFVAGWGQTMSVGAGSSSESLLYNDVKLLPEKQCRYYIPSLYSLFDKFCTIKNNYTEVSIAQPGDSGGGLTVVHDGHHYIFGIVSVKLSRDSNQMTLFTNVSRPGHESWIENKIKNYDTNFRWSEF